MKQASERVNVIDINRVTEAVESLRDEMVGFIGELVRIPSLPARETPAQELLAKKMASFALDVEKYPIDSPELRNHPAFSHDGFSLEDRINVTGRWPGTGGGRTLILNGHLDVVSTGPQDLWQDSPWSGKLRKGRIFGRGSADMKAGLAAALFALRALQNLGYEPGGDVWLQGVVGEETGGCGTLANIIKGYRAHAAIIMEPTSLRIYPLHSGALSFRIKIKGKPVHACLKNSGVSAIEKFYVIFNALEKLDKKRHQTYKNPLFPDALNVAPLSVGTLQSGDWPSSVPGELIAQGRLGVFPGESLEHARESLTNCIENASRDDEWLTRMPPELEWFEGQFEPAETGLEEPIIRTLSTWHREICKKPVEFRGASFGSDARLFSNYAHMPAILYGPGDINEAHSANESIAVEEVLTAVKVLALTIMDWCSSSTGLNQENEID